MTFLEAKNKLSIINVASYLGYKYDPTKGHNTPSFVLVSGGQEVDRIYIKNPDNNMIQGYWRRTGEKGDLIDFIREKLPEFSISYYNEIDGINKTIALLLNEDISKYEKTQYKFTAPKPFDPSRWQHTDNSYRAKYLLSKRNIQDTTYYTFRDYIYTIIDRKSSRNFENLGFPYKEIGGSSIVGYEIRGMNGFKSKAEGTNSHTACWTASFNDPEEITQIYLFESVLDALSFYQLKHSKIDLRQSALVSFGGAFSSSQIKLLSNHYPNALFTTAFDNDLQGNLYDIKVYHALNGLDYSTSVSGENVIIKTENSTETTLTKENLSLSNFLRESKLSPSPSLVTIKPQKGFKDWNEVISRIDQTPTQSKYTSPTIHR